jgi:hypothetical protein
MKSWLRIRMIAASLAIPSMTSPLVQAAESPSACIVKSRAVTDIPFPLGKSLVMKTCDGEPTQNT